MIDKYCVYSHSHEGVIFYIGCGQAEIRPYCQTGRGGAWNRKVADIDGFTIDIIHLSNDRNVMAMEERKLILKLRPECNLQALDSNVQVPIKQVTLSEYANNKLNEIVKKRKASNNLVRTKQDVVEELITAEYHKEFNK